MVQFRRWLVAGTGDVVSQRIRPAVKRLSEWHRLQSITYFDVVPQPARFRMEDFPIPEQFVQIHDSGSAVHQLMPHGILGPDTLLLICTPSPLHVPYARSFAEFVGRIGVEKPLSLNPQEAAMLQDYEVRVFPINHQLWKPGMLCLAADCHFGRLNVDEIGQLEFRLLETKGVGDRAIDDAIWDLGWHGLECGVSPFVAAGRRVSLEIESVRVATYSFGPDRPRRSTAARVEAVLHTDHRQIPLTICVGKGQARGSKGLTVFDHSDQLLRKVSLSDPDNRGHRLALSELLSPSRPFMPLSMGDVIDVVAACSDASSRAIVMPHYPFGTTPDWLADLQAATDSVPPSPHLSGSLKRRTTSSVSRHRSEV